MRFYRIVLTDTNDAANAPHVSIQSPTNNAVLTGDIVVSVGFTNADVDTIRVFVDGQEVGHGAAGETNFVVNTCQFENGSHKIFAVVENSSGAETTGETNDFVSNLGVSSFVSVTFDNLITDYRGKLRFQDPAQNETNGFSADFATNVSWTLTITNQDGVTVRTATGNGFAVGYTWDGTGEGGTNLPSGGYSVVLSAAATGGRSQTTVLKHSPLPSVWFGSIGSIGVAYQGNHPDNTSFGLNTRPSNGLGGRVTLNVTPGSYGKLKAPHKIALGFNRYMGDAGYRLKFNKGNFDLRASDLRKPSTGGNSIFNNVNVGFLIGHGVYGTTPDFTISASGPLQSYYPVYAGGSGYDWVRLSEFDFGSTNLRWMSILTCNNLVDSVYDDCYDKEALPVNDDLHLLCGAKTSDFMVSNFGLKYSAALTGRGTIRKTIVESWFLAGTETQAIQPGGPHVTVVFRVIGWPNCFNDDLISYQAPNSGNPADITFQDRQVYP